MLETLWFDMHENINMAIPYSLLVCKNRIQWNLRIKDTFGAELLSSIRRLSFGGRFEPICNL